VPHTISKDVLLSSSVICLLIHWTIESATFCRLLEMCALSFELRAYIAEASNDMKFSLRRLDEAHKQSGSLKLFRIVSSKLLIPPRSIHAAIDDHALTSIIKRS